MANKFEDYTEEGLIEFLNQGGLRDEDFEEFHEALRAKGLSGSIMAVDDPDSEEGKAAVEYVKYHKKIPDEYYKNMPENEIELAKKILTADEVPIKEKKRALVILAHTGRIDAYKALEEYEKNAKGELKIWIVMAIQECQSFLKRDLMDEPIVSIGRIAKLGRNEPCVCGSGKKYKKCCLNKTIS